MATTISCARACGACSTTGASCTVATAADTDELLAAVVDELGLQGETGIDRRVSAVLAYVGHRG